MTCVGFCKKHARLLVLLVIFADAVYLIYNICFTNSPNSILQRNPSLPVNAIAISRWKDGNLSVVLSPNHSEGLNSGGGNVTSNPVPLDVNIVLHNVSLCESCPGLRWLFYVHSAAKNRVKRDVIRGTWGNPALHSPCTTRLVFMLGRTRNRKLQASIKEEQRQCGDIVQGDFMDSYLNLTVKAVMALKWITTYCKNAAFFLKTDDDIVFNIFDWMKVAEAAAHQHSRLIMCPLWQAGTMPILRNSFTCMKWCVKSDEFPGQNYYSQYCSGWAVTMSQEIVSEMYHVATKTPLFRIDDVFLTGLVAGKLKDVHYVDVLRNLTNVSGAAIKQFLNSTIRPTLLVSSSSTVSNFKKLWVLMLRRHQMAGNKTMLANASDIS